MVRLYINIRSNNFPLDILLIQHKCSSISTSIHFNCNFLTISHFAQKLSGFGRGISPGVTFFVVLEAMYVMQIPVFSDKANEFACGVLDIPEERCQQTK